MSADLILNRLPGADDGRPLVAPYSAVFRDADGHHDDITVVVFTGADGATVVQIDTDASGADERVRVNVNYGTVFDRRIESGTNYGDELHERNHS